MPSENKYHIIILPYIYTHYLNNILLFYNTLSNEKVVIPNEKSTRSLVLKIAKKKGINTIGVSTEEYAKPAVARLIRTLVKQRMICLLDAEKSNKPPFQLSPEVFLLSDVEKLHAPNLGFDYVVYERLNNVKTYTKQLYLYINNYTKRGIHCQHRLFPSFLFAKQAHELPLNLLARLLDEIKDSNIQKLDISGGNIFMHSQIHEIIPLLSIQSYPVSIHVLHKELDLNRLIENFHYVIHIVPGEDHRKLAETIAQLQQANVRYSLDFIIFDDCSFSEGYGFIREHNITNYAFHPIVQNNTDFLEKNLILTEDEIFAEAISMQSIFRNQKMNINYFGQVTILSDARIFSNVNGPSLGNLNEIHLFDAISGEFSAKGGWRTTRQDIQPCRRCVYQALCPPPSNYEYVMKRFNLCSNNLQSLSK